MDLYAIVEFADIRGMILKSEIFFLQFLGILLSI